MIAALTSSMFVVPIVSTRNAVSAAPVAPPRLDAAADEPEQPLGLARVVDVVGQRPELADEQDAEDQAEEVEGDRRPSRCRLA